MSRAHTLAGFTVAELQAERMRSGNWIVRPRGACGTCGFYPRAWAAVNVGKRPRNEAAAVLRALT